MKKAPRRRAGRDKVSPDETAAGDDLVIARAMRWSLALFVIAGIIVVAVVLLMDQEPEAADNQTDLAAPQVRDDSQADIPRVTFTDVTRQAGIQFVHTNGAYGDKLLPETMGGGCAFFDYDDDGDQDILLVNACHWPGCETADEPPTMALYQNDGRGRFTDVTAGSGLDVTFYGMGAACGDFDNDGLVDVFISALGPNRLFRNTGGRFADVTSAAGVGGWEGEWNSSCGWFDYDNDGDLDLFVASYVHWTKEIDLAQDFQLLGVGRAYGPPTAFPGTFSYLYRNDGDGRFTDVTRLAGIEVRNSATGVRAGKSLGIAPVDLDNDGWMDLVVANDTVRNFVFHNQQDGTFQEKGIATGVALDMSGNARGAMGIDAARFRGDDSLGITIGNFANEMTALYVSQGQSLLFVDDAIAAGLGPPTRLELTFGLFFFDYDLDGRLDILAANGHIDTEINKVQESMHYQQPPHLLWNAGAAEATEFVTVPADKCGADLTRPMVARGAAYADIDGDGDLDVLLTSIGHAPRLLRNDQQLPHHWVRFRLTGTRSNRDAIGARVEVHVAGRILRRQVMPTRSYLSQVELPVTFGIGAATAIDKAVIHWPDGTFQELTDVEVDTLKEVEQPNDAAGAPEKVRISR